MNSDIVIKLQQQIHKILDLIKNDIGTIRTGRATPSLVENIVVSVYGGSTKLKVMEVATIGASDAQTLVITPFDVSIIEEIRKGISDASVGFNPVVDGQIIRISIPQLSEERRQELIKAMKHKLENGRIMVRQARHDAMSDIKKQHTDKTISDDDMQRLEKEVQKVVDETIGTIDTMGKQKESELMQM